MKPIVADKSLVAYCGIYCGACKKYLSGSCPGCHENEKASWCKVRSCCMENGYASCAGCIEFSNPMDCKKFNNFFSKFFALIFRSDREAGISKIKDSGYEEYAAFMASNKLPVIRRN
jgi:hypothetical protein